MRCMASSLVAHVPHAIAEMIMSLTHESQSRCWIIWPSFRLKEIQYIIVKLSVEYFV